MRNSVSKMVALVPAVLTSACVVFAQSEDNATKSDAAASDGIVITSTRLAYDYGKKYVVFDENVKVVDSNLVIHADRVTAVFRDDDTVERITAIGSVRMEQDEMVASCSTARCDVARGIVVLTGDASIKRGEEMLKGRKITLLRDTNKLLCEGDGYLRIKPGKTPGRSLKLSD